MSNKVTPSSQWKRKSQGEELEVPSGNVCLARRVSMDVFLKKGVLPNSLMPIVEKALKEGQAPDITNLADLDIKADQINEIIQMYNHVVYHIVVEPKLYLPPKTDDYGNEIDLRDPEKLYVDEVDFEDKVFLFQWAVGSTADVEQFRAEQEEVMAPLRPVEDVASTS